MIANKTDGLDSENRFVISLLNNLLGGPGLNTRLNLGIREKYGFCYNIESNYTPYSDSGIFNIYLGTDFKTIDKSIELVLKELEKLRSKKLGSLQLDRAKKQFIGQNAIADDESINRLMSYGRSIMSWDYIMPDSEFEEIISKISATEILEAANILFDPDNLYYLIYNKK
jgi:predicted Zn-dependent peptidase